MLPDTAHSQGASLCAYAAQLGPRIVALASHGDRDSELPLIWRLCAAWTELGYSVTVLDATARESTRNPGLKQRLSASDSGQAALGDVDHADPSPDASQAWPIVPAARGWALLPRSGAEAAACIGRLFHGADVVLIYAPACELVRSFGGLALSPVLTSSSQGPCILNAYQAFRHLLIDGALQPTIVCTMNASAPAPDASAGLQAGVALQDCALALLGHRARLLELPAADASDRNALHSLALRLLETALSAPATPAPIHHEGMRLPALAAASGGH